MGITIDYGSFLLGSLVATLLSGMNTLQAILYFRLYPKDPIFIRILVAVIWCLDIAHTVLIWVSAWLYFIVYIGQLEKIDDVLPELVPGVTVITTIVTLVVHLFYLHRIFILSHRNYRNYRIIVPIFILALTHVAGAMATTGEWIRAKRFSVFEASKARWILSLGFVFGATVDVAIMISMFFLLKKSRSKSISLNDVIDKLILYTLEIGSVTAMVGVASTIAWFASPLTLLCGSIYLCIEKLYVLSFMGLLNARSHLRNQEGQRSLDWKTIQFAHTADTTTPNTAQMKPKKAPFPEVHIDVTKSIKYDDGPGSSKS